MNNKLVSLALTAVLLVACAQSDAPTSPSAGSPSSSPPPATTDLELAQGDAVLINGYIPAFPHKVRSMRDEGNSHFVVVEYLGVDRDVAIAAMSDSLRGKGFKVAGPQPREAAVQYVYIGTDGRRMSAIFSDPSSARLMNPDAQGIAMFSWTDTAAN
ncbi:hypothetical protein [Novilysobacter erysipheiresistens]|uniref:SPOR domain-containing protein n=1 Tax=Novilysobacter erysipheiresistens TaxID=1749332 RepID=A0ABU7YYW8_9GAMM